MNKIDESSRRWPDFQGGRPITLPDGAVWWFATPEPLIRLTDDEAVPSWRFADAPLVDAVLAGKFAAILLKIGNATTTKERTSATLEAAWFLLARNYRITPDEFESILMESAMWDDVDQAEVGRELGELVDDVMRRSLSYAGEVA